MLLLYVYNLNASIRTGARKDQALYCNIAVMYRHLSSHTCGKKPQESNFKDTISGLVVIRGRGVRQPRPFALLAIWPTSGCHSKVIKILTMIMANKFSRADISNLSLDHEIRSQNNNFSPVTMGQIPGCHGHGQCLNPTP